MERLTSHKSKCKREMVCRYEDCDTCEEYGPHLNEDNCSCLQEVIDKLAEYEDLEEQGKLLKLPCAVGDTVYSSSFVKVLTFRVDSFVIYADGIDARLVSDMDECKSFKADLDIADFGKKWFATREEAEATLENYFMG